MNNKINQIFIHYNSWPYTELAENQFIVRTQCRLNIYGSEKENLTLTKKNNGKAYFTKKLSRYFERIDLIIWLQWYSLILDSR